VYCIILEDLEEIALGALRTAVELNMDIVLIDEIGPMGDVEQAIQCGDL